MRYATSCVVCAGALPAKSRADCRYCGIRCRVRAYRIRADGGGCLRSDAQRREIRDVRAVLQASAAATAETAQRLATAASDAEQARDETRRMQLRLDEVEQALKAEQHSLAEVRRAEAKQTKRYQTIEEEANKLAEVAEMQREKIAKLRADVRQLSEERDSLRRIQHQGEVEAGPRESTIRALVEQRDAMMAEAARLRVKLRKHAPRQSEVDALQATLTQVEQERETLRGTVTRQKQELATAKKELATIEQERSALRESVGELESEQKRSEQARATLESQVSRLTEQLARSDEDLKAWRRSAQLGVAKGIGDMLLGLGADYVESVNGPSPRSVPSEAKKSVSVPASIPPPAPPPAAPSAAVPAVISIETEEDVLWRQRIDEAKQQGWDPRSDTVVLRMLQQFRDEDRRAQQQLAKGQAVTVKRIPPGSDLDYLAIRAAIDVRVNYRREREGRWVLKWFQLDPLSESRLVTALMMEELKMTQDLLRSGR